MVTSAPEANEVIDIVANTQKLMAACARSFSSGRYAASASVVLPVNRKFQPTPSSSSALTKCISSTPDSAMPTHARFSTTPAPITGSTPKRLISEPVTKPGAYMPITCHCSTMAVAPNSKPHTCMASGVAAISRFITP